MMILITGAAGLIGGELTAQLLAADHSIVAITHNTQQLTANDGRQIATSPLENGWPAAGEVATLAGDITKANLNITPQIYTQLSSKIDMIIHCAATTDFGASDAAYQAINIDGTANMLALSPNIRFLHVSTAYVCGAAEGKVAEDLEGKQHCFTNGYEASKAKAEQLVNDAPNHTAIARPSIVVGRHGCGTIGSFDNFYQFFKYLAEGRITVLPAAQHAALNFVPIDYVGSALCDIVSAWPDAAGQIFHLTAENAVSLEMLLNVLTGFDGLNTPDILTEKEHLEMHLSRAERRLGRKLLALYSGYLQRAPKFLNHRLEQISGRKPPVMDDNAVTRQIQYCVDSGFIKPPRTHKAA